MRGKLLLVFWVSLPFRITPAGAGKTPACACGIAVVEDHPRRCGENIDGVVTIRNVVGSPPQVRGKLRASTGRTGSSRITPAGAGKTLFQIVNQCMNEDHPRRCGENLTQPSRTAEPPGSPPQVRGKLFIVPVFLLGAGITPAGAGKTQGRNVIASINRDHPRRCGENTLSREKAQECQGSPPQVRGKLTIGFVFVWWGGITPAGAGKTKTAEVGNRRHWDHPRRCGENTTTHTPVQCSVGSPPQVRGKQINSIAVRRNIRITPAGAGKTRYQSTESGCIKDHPRRCGENTVQKSRENAI